MKVKYADAEDSSAWEEPITVFVDTHVTAEQHAQETVDYFNRTLKPHEKERKLVSVKDTVIDKTAIIPHNWIKISLVTEKGGYDKMKCTQCGATGKRYGLYGVRIDSKFKHRKYSCKPK